MKEKLHPVLHDHRRLAIRSPLPLRPARLWHHKTLRRLHPLIRALPKRQVQRQPINCLNIRQHLWRIVAGKLVEVLQGILNALVGPSADFVADRSDGICGHSRLTTPERLEQVYLFGHAWPPRRPCGPGFAFVGGGVVEGGELVPVAVAVFASVDAAALGMSDTLIALRQDGLFPVGVLETEGAGVFRDSALGLVLGAVRETGLNLDADFYLRVGVGDENGDDFLGDLHEAHFRGGGVDRDVAVE